MARWRCDRTRSVYKWGSGEIEYSTMQNKPCSSPINIYVSTDPIERIDNGRFWRTVSRNLFIKKIYKSIKFMNAFELVVSKLHTKKPTSNTNRIDAVFFSLCELAKQPRVAGVITSTFSWEKNRELVNIYYMRWTTREVGVVCARWMFLNGLPY